MIHNKVTESELVTLDLKSFIPRESPEIFDLKNYLFKGLILREKDYRESLQKTDWNIYQNQIVLVQCSADVIIPVWAYMLANVYLTPVAKEIFFDCFEDWKEKMIIRNLHNLNGTDYLNKRVVIKGCGEESIPDSAYFHITAKLLPHVKSLMYGEPCSTVPIYKRKL